MIRKIGLVVIPMLAGAALTIVALNNFGVRESRAASDQDIYQNLVIFGDIFERVRREYVEEPSEKELIENAINGMLTSLDPHSSYLTAEDFQDMQVDTKGEFGGLGIEVTMQDGLVKVVSPIDDTPAARAGIQAGDLIFEIDGELVRGLSLGEAVDKMRGLVDTDIKIKVIREGLDSPLDFTLTREIITIKAVKHSLEGGDIGYVRITKFNEQALSGLLAAVDDINQQADGNIKGYIIDLRSNPGGLLDQAVAISDAFLERGEIVSTRGREPQSVERYSAREGDIAEGKPVIILVNGGSASASEIVAGALQDQERATILGTRSFGKGSVQSVIPLGPHGAIRLTTARYYTPAGTSIRAKGIEPDIRVVQDVPEDLKDRLIQRSESQLRGHLDASDEQEEEGSFDYVPAEKEKDAQFQYALKLIHGEIENEKYISELQE